ncbi:MAG: ParB N-terminal domain-containing protein [Deltaproteobacteria bacterium]|nr:ParB N-terminal domain-containing protein [Deltaproteobacteria bacterium]
MSRTWVVRASFQCQRIPMSMTENPAIDLIPCPDGAPSSRPRHLEFHQLELSYRAQRCQDSKRQAKLTASLCEQGQQSPVLVVEQLGREDRYVLIDGYRRVAALSRLGHDTILALVLPLDEVGAICLTHRMQGSQQRSAIEQGWMLQELIEGHGLSQVELGLRLGHSTSWVSRRLALVRDLPEGAQALVRRGRISPYGAMRHLVPLARAKGSACEQLLAGLGEASLSVRQLGQLSRAWHSASPFERDHILEQPLLYLRLEEASPSPTDSARPEGLLRRDLDALRAIAHRARRVLGDELGPINRLPLTIGGAWQQALRAFDELQKQMEERLNAGYGNETSDSHPQGQGPRKQSHLHGTTDLQNVRQESAP